MDADAENGRENAQGRLYPAILLLGPTGSGKTPLGELLEARGLWGRRCLHFDFGMNLRRCASGTGTRGALTREERDFLARVLESGALLEDEHFPIARKALLGFLGSRGAADGGAARGTGMLVVLNGLPRHVGQAQALDSIVSMQLVVNLACEPEVVVERIRTNAGGDRGGRSDDELTGVRKRIGIFRERTAPLLQYYGSRGVGIVQVDVGVNTTPLDVHAKLARSRV